MGSRWCWTSCIWVCSYWRTVLFTVSIITHYNCTLLHMIYCWGIVEASAFRKIMGSATWRIPNRPIGIFGSWCTDYLGIRMMVMLTMAAGFDRRSSLVQSIISSALHLFFTKDKGVVMNYNLFIIILIYIPYVKFIMLQYTR